MRESRGMLREAHRPAFATTFEAAGETAWFSPQWRNKQLHLINIPGVNTLEQEATVPTFFSTVLADA